MRSTNLYRVDPETGRLSVVAGDIARPNGLAFSPDERSSTWSRRGCRRESCGAYEVTDGGRKLGVFRKLIDAGAGTPDGLRLDVDGNSWIGWGIFMAASTSIYSLYVNTQGVAGG